MENTMVKGIREWLNKITPTTEMQKTFYEAVERNLSHFENRVGPLSEAEQEVVDFMSSLAESDARFLGFTYCTHGVYGVVEKPNEGGFSMVSKVWWDSVTKEKVVARPPDWLEIGE